MDKETLFNAIQRREVVLWAGAGFSRYAGFPLGAGIVRHLFEALSSGQKQAALDYFSAHDKEGYPLVALPAFASFYVNLHNGQLQPLRREILKLYSKRPESLKTHEELATIPFIEHIVTTNYDTLFEQAYGTDKVHVITEGTHLAYMEPSKVNLYKVHGSLERPNSLLVTEDEYRRFYSKVDQQLWHYIEGLMLTKTMLFVGYGLEDQNVMALFEQVLTAIGSNMHGAYLVAPGLNPMRVDWLRRHNVTYIDSTGEQLVEELLQFFKDTAVPALKQGKCEIGPTTAFLRNLGLHPTFATQQSGFDISAISSTKKDATQQIHFKLNQDGHNALKALKTGSAGLALKLDPSKLLHFEWRVEGVNLGVDVNTLWLVRTAAMQKTLDVEFSGGFSLPDVSLHVFGGTEAIRFIVTTSHLKLEVTVLPKNIKTKGVRYNCSFQRRHPYIESVDTGLHQAQVMKVLGSGEGLTAYENGALIWSTENSGFSKSFREEGEALEENMLGLKAIEKAFGLRFKRFILSRNDRETIRILYRILQMKNHTDRWAEKMEVFRHEEFDGDLVKFAQDQRKQDNSLVSIFEHEHTFYLCGWELHLRYTIAQAVHEPVIKKTKGKYFLSSADKKVTTVYNPEQTATIIKQGEPHALVVPPRPELPEELAQLTKKH